MTVVDKHGKRILEKPFWDSVLEGWQKRNRNTATNVRSPPSYSYLLLFQCITTCLCFLLVFACPATASETTEIMNDSEAFNQELRETNNQQYTLQYHFSPWMTKQLWERFATSDAIRDCKVERCSNVSISSKSSETVSIARFIEKKTKQNTFNALNTVNSSRINSPGSSSASSAASPSHPSEAQSEESSSLTWTDNSRCTSLDSLHFVRDYMKTVTSFNFQQCLLLDKESVEEICDLPSQERRSKVEQYNLKHCHRYPLISVLSNDAWFKVINTSSCSSVLHELYALDALANRLFCDFDAVLSRYNCLTYSIRCTCDACRTAYSEWLCSMLLPFYASGVNVKPCRSFCEKVEQKCPYLHPASGEQYAGEPVFICIGSIYDYELQIYRHISKKKLQLCHCERCDNQFESEVCALCRLQIANSNNSELPVSSDPQIPFSENATNVPYGDNGNCYESCNLANDRIADDKNDIIWI